MVHGVFTMKLKAVIFDVDGTMTDSEQWGHMPACNDAFKIIGLNLQWDWKTFLPLLGKIPGNANRLRHVLQTSFDYDDTTIEKVVERFARVKKEVYVNKYAPKMRLRNGIRSFIHKIAEKNIRLAIVTTSYEKQVHALLEHQLASFKEYFNPILGKETGIKTGEAGMLYEKCLAIMKLKPAECLVIEDSGSGAKAAMKANIPTVVTYNDYTKGDNFKGAQVVTDSIDNIDVDKLLKR